MTWEHCDASVPDNDPCPSCGISKQEWTVEFELTRSFTVRRKLGLRLEVVDGAEEPVVAQALRVEPPEGEAEELETNDLGQAAVAGGEGRYRLVFVGQAQANVQRAGDAPEGVDDPSEGAEASFECEGARRRQRFVLAPRLHLIVQGAEGPLAGVRYRLVLGEETREGETVAEGDDAGLVDEAIPAGVTEGELTVWPSEGGPGMTLRLAVGALEGAESTKGAQARLNALGYVSGKVDGDAGAMTQDALRRFQKAHSLEESGAFDEATRAKLVEVFGT